RKYPPGHSNLASQTKLHSTLHLKWRFRWHLYLPVWKHPFLFFLPADDDVASEKEEEESVPWENQRIAKPRAALLGQWESVQRQGKACKIQHGRLQDSRPRVNCAGGKKKGSNSQQGTNTRSREQTLQHKCTFCGKAFKTKSTLGRHHQIHIKGKPYKCTICGKAFVYRYTLAHHQEIHLEDQLYQHKCSFCTKAFRTPSALRRHQQLHKEGKPYICNICGKAFAYSTILRYHQRTHTGERPYKCAVCDKSYISKWSLKKHLELHYKKNPPKDLQEANPLDQKC
uniref:C2H2-type domain-containing protein n=1 Tax=Naja naja TaxID=35670 RepID=A0A8C6VI32_NAJNA